MPLVDATTADFCLLIKAVLDNPQDDTPKGMLYDYLAEAGDPRAGLLRARDQINADLSGLQPREPYVHGNYAAPKEVRHEIDPMGKAYNPHSSQRLLAIALVRRLCLWLFTGEPKREFYAGPDTTPDRINWEWFHRFMCAADLYSCRLIPALQRDWYMRRQMDDAWVDPNNAVRTAVQWWFYFGKHSGGAATDVSEWRYRAVVNRIRLLFLACRAGKYKTLQTYESVTAAARNHGLGHTQTHNMFRAITDTWGALTPWVAEQQVRREENERKELRRAARPE